MKHGRLAVLALCSACANDDVVVAVVPTADGVRAGIPVLRDLVSERR